MKVVRVEVAVECDDGVTDNMVTTLIKVHMAICFNETRGGEIKWPKLKVRAIRGD